MLLSLAALAATFLISNLNMTFFTKLLIFISISFLYLLFGMLVGFRRKREVDVSPLIVNPKTIFNEEVEATVFRRVAEIRRYVPPRRQPSERNHPVCDVRFVRRQRRPINFESAICRRRKYERIR